MAAKALQPPPFHQEVRYNAMLSLDNVYFWRGADIERVNYGGGLE